MYDLDREQSGQLKRVTTAAVVVAVTLVLAKLVAWSFTGSVAILSSLADSVMDALASSLNAVAIRTALVPPDQEHRFGHGKAEPLAGLGQTAFILGASLFLVANAVEHLVSSAPIAHPAVGQGVMLFAIVLTGGLVLYQRRVLRAVRSVAVEGDSLHYSGDLLLNVAVLGSIIAADYGWAWVDGVAAIGVALYMSAGAVRIGRRSLAMLMDAELPEEDRVRILEIARGNAQVLGVHDLRTRRSGRQLFIQLHLELPGEMSLSEAHAIGDHVAQEVVTAFPAAEVLVHTDPAEEEQASGPRAAT